LSFHLGLLLLARQSYTTTKMRLLLLELLAFLLKGLAKATTQRGLSSLLQPLLDDSDLVIVTACFIAI